MSKSLKIGLGATQFQTGLDEICSHFEVSRSDEYLNGLVSAVDEANQALYATMQIMAKKRSFNEEAMALTQRLSSARHYVRSCCFEGDAEVRDSAAWVKALWQTRETKPFNHMKVEARIGSARLLLGDLSTSEAQHHVERLPELAARLQGIQKAIDELTDKQLEVDEANGNSAKRESLLDLKRRAATKLASLLLYLEAMEEKDPDTYGEHLRSVTEIITRLNTTARGGAQKKQTDVSGEEPTPATPEVPDAVEPTPRLTVSA